MIALRNLKAEEKGAARQRQVILKLNAIVKDIERCERTIGDLQQELADVNSKHQGPRTTRQDVEYLSGLLACAKKKLAWEKQIAALQKKAPALLQEMSAVLNDPLAPPQEATRVEI